MKRKRTIKFSEVVPILYPLTGIAIITFDLFTKRENVVIECYGLAFLLFVFRMEYLTFKEKRMTNNTKMNST